MLLVYECVSWGYKYMSLLLSDQARIAIEAPATTGVSGIKMKRCPKCGTAKKSGKLSCCARGGAWFQKCGAAGDTHFEHSWTDGIQACNGFASSSLDEASVHARHERNITLPKNTSELQNAVRQDIECMSYADTANSKDPVTILKITFLSLLGPLIYIYRHGC